MELLEQNEEGTMKMTAGAAGGARRRFAVLVLVVSAMCLGQTEVERATPSTTAADTGPVAEPKPTLKPRLALHIPSAKAMVEGALQSHSGVFVENLAGALREMASASAEGVDVETAEALVSQVAAWPDTSISAFTYAPDTEGRMRWAIRLDWPLRDLHERCQAGSWR